MMRTRRDIPARRARLGRLCLGAAAGLVLGLALSGCKYSVEVRNATQRPVSVQMVQQNVDGWEWLIDSDRIPPGKVVTLGPSNAYFSTVMLELDATDEDAFGTRTKLRPGRSSFDVRESIQGNAIVFELVARANNRPQRQDMATEGSGEAAKDKSSKEAAAVPAPPAPARVEPAR